ncbi:hypothetical protein [Mycobacterium sp. SMC-19]|uniref:hypothetical protein n=1 Tax=Mycobacterium sp. SMC-19 TaxID=3381630 RepID=UPI003876515E
MTAKTALKRIDVARPPTLGKLSYDVVVAVARTHEAALIALARLGEPPRIVGGLLLRSESVASFKIEDIEAAWRTPPSRFADLLIAARAGA